MTTMIPAPFLLLLVFSAANAAPSPDSCSQARMDLERVIADIPRTCSSDSDCDGYYYRDDLSPHAVILSKPGVPPSLEPRLFAAQDAARTACARFIPPGGAVPKPFKASCYAKRCEDAKTTFHRKIGPIERLFNQPMLLISWTLFGFVFGFWRNRWETERTAPAYAVATRIAVWLGVVVACIVFSGFLRSMNLESRGAPFAFIGSVMVSPMVGLFVGGAFLPFIYAVVYAYYRASAR